jgi:hypothetical protein
MRKENMEIFNLFQVSRHLSHAYINAFQSRFRQQLEFTFKQRQYIYQISGNESILLEHDLALST